MQIVFTKRYKNHRRGDEMEVGDEIAIDLINRGLARAVPQRVERADTGAQEAGCGADLR